VAAQKYGAEMCLERVVKSKGYFQACYLDGFYLGAQKFEEFALLSFTKVRLQKAPHAERTRG
jgi:hypothetical protein